MRKLPKSEHCALCARDPLLHPRIPTAAEVPTGFETSAFVSFRGWQPWLVLIILIASRLLLVTFARDLSGDDGWRYLTEAINVWAHGTFSADSGAYPAPTAQDMPLFPLIIAGFIALSKIPLLASKMTSVLNCILFGVAARGVYDLGWRLTGSFATATLAMLIFGCFPESFPYAVFYMPESLFLALFVWCLVKFVQYLRSKNSRWLIWAFVLWGLSVLTKPISLFVGPLLAIIAAVFILHDRTNLINRISFAMIGLFLGASLLVPWLVRNYMDFGVVGLSSVIGSNLLYVNYSRVLGEEGVAYPTGILIAEEAAAAKKLAPEHDNPMARSALETAMAEKALLAHIGSYFVVTLKRSPRLYAGTGSLATLRLLGDTESVSAIERALADRHTWREVPARALILQLISWLCLGVTYAAVALGVIKTIRRRNWLTACAIMGGLLYFAVLIGPLTDTRYRVTMLPALSVAAAIGFSGDVKAQRQPRG